MIKRHPTSCRHVPGPTCSPPHFSPHEYHCPARANLTWCPWWSFTALPFSSDRCDPALPLCWSPFVLSSFSERDGVPPGSRLVGGGREKILIVISQANDLWSIFRPEPHMTWEAEGHFMNVEWGLSLFSHTSGTHHMQWRATQSPPPPFEDELIILLLTAPCRRPAQLLILILSALCGKMSARDWIV